MGQVSRCFVLFSTLIPGGVQGGKEEEEERREERMEREREKTPETQISEYTILNETSTEGFLVYKKQKRKMR
jgi:hypothetical protein